jgi:hypothetical protein
VALEAGIGSSKAASFFILPHRDSNCTIGMLSFPAGFESVPQAQADFGNESREEIRETLSAVKYDTIPIRHESMIEECELSSKSAPA